MPFKLLVMSSKLDLGPYDVNEAKRGYLRLLIHTIWPSGHNVCEEKLLVPKLNFGETHFCKTKFNRLGQFLRC